ncbi:hypothetical protein ONZ43_g1194 [Nemania bipapillata]|uniref:Uncharacterized protein n=1 Tax=Nemania bipapillata TaxID=110536 RepID=A0ACC2J5E0_9PEZI|nr:hypothetical protein ONZ43_g1194 [Nemania bipapillata]
MVNVGQELTVCGISKPMCARQRDTDLSICVFNSVSDLIIFVLPLWPIWRLQMEKGAKIGLSIVLLLGTITILVAFLRFEAIVHTDYDDQYNSTAMKSFNFAILEPNLAILCISLPMLQPLIRKVRGQGESFNRSPSRPSSCWAGNCFGDTLTQLSSGSVKDTNGKSTVSPAPESARVNIELSVVSARAGDGELACLGAGSGKADVESTVEGNASGKRKECKKRNRDGSLLSRARSLWSVDLGRPSQDGIVGLARHSGTRPKAASDASPHNLEDWNFSPVKGMTTTTITSGKA